MENLKKMNEEYNIIGKDTIKVYGFRFGMHRYQVEHFDHNHSGKPKDDGKIHPIDFWDDISGTRVYRFLDGEYNFSICSALFFGEYIEKDELKKLILGDGIDWKTEDPYDFRYLFMIDRNDLDLSDIIDLNRLYPKDDDSIVLDYPECEEPYEKCPICGGKLDESDFEMDCAVDIFNSRGGYGYEGEYWGEWDEVHRCPHCDKLFYVHAEC